MINPDFAKEATEKFSGCDSTEIEAGNSVSPSIWLFGLEHGTYKSKHDENTNTREEIEDANYTVETQLKWPYNRRAFKLLAAIDEEYGVKKYLEFAKKRQPFVRGSKGYFKGNLYPYPCHNVGAWPESAVKTTGALTKNEYLQWCKEYRLPIIKAWVEEYSPKVVIGVGITHRNEFSLAVFGVIKEFTEKNITINGHKKRLFHYSDSDKKLVIIPHFSGRHGLNSDESLEKAGELIRELIENRIQV